MYTYTTYSANKNPAQWTESAWSCDSSWSYFVVAVLERVVLPVFQEKKQQQKLLGLNFLLF